MDPEIFPVSTIAKFFALLREGAPHFVPACRWLLLGPGVASALFPEETSGPDRDDLAELLRWVNAEAPRLSAFTYQLIGTSPLAEDAVLELQLDRLLERSDWEFPTVVLDGPRPDLRKLWKAAEDRLRQAPASQQPQLRDVVTKLERSVRIVETAEERRRRMRRKAGRSPN